MSIQNKDEEKKKCQWIPCDTEISKHIRHFVNDIASKLNLSNDTMEAVRLFRAELPRLLNKQKNMIREEIEEMKWKEIDPHDENNGWRKKGASGAYEHYTGSYTAKWDNDNLDKVLSLPSLNIKEDE